MQLPVALQSPLATFITPVLLPPGLNVSPPWPLLLGLPQLGVRLQDVTMNVPALLPNHNGSIGIRLVTWSTFVPTNKGTSSISRKSI